VEWIVRLHIEKLPEGVYLATSDDVQGLIAQGRTINEAVEIARDVARRLIEAQQERSGGPEFPEPGDAFDYPMLVAV
jgi:predicted RNase H-like HicB family nuclease